MSCNNENLTLLKTTLAKLLKIALTILKQFKNDDFKILTKQNIWTDWGHLFGVDRGNIVKL